MTYKRISTNILLQNYYIRKIVTINHVLHPNYYHWFPNCWFWNLLRLNPLPNLPLNSPPCPWFKKSRFWFWKLSMNPPFCPQLPPFCQLRLFCHLSRPILPPPIGNCLLQMSMGQSLHCIPFSNPNVSSLHSGDIHCSVQPTLQCGIALEGIGTMFFLIIFLP